jgi:hypothetical protein
MTTQYIIRIANYLDGSGNELEFTTSTGVRPYLATSPTIAGATMAALDPIAASGGMVWDLIAPIGALQPLLRRDLGAPAGSSVPARLVEYVTETDSSIVLNVTGLTTPQYVFVGGETMYLTAEPTPGTYTVIRGIGSLGRALVHQWVYETQPPPLVLSRPTNPTGHRVEVSDNTGVIYRGVLRSVTRTDHGCSLDIVSMVGWLRERKQLPVPPSNYDAGGLNQCTLSIDDRVLEHTATYSDSWAPQRARLWWGDLWAVVAVGQADLMATNDQYLWSVGTQAILQWGKGETAYPLETPPDGLDKIAEASGRAESKVTRVEALWTTPVAPPSTVLEAMLTDIWPPGQVGGMDVTDVGDLLALDLAYGVGDLYPPYSVDTLWWPGATKQPMVLADAIAANMIAPLFCGMTAMPDGRVMALDWLACLGATQTVLQADLIRGLGGVSDTQPVKIVRWTASELGGEQVLNFQSDLVSQVVGGGREVAVKPGWLQAAAGWMYDRLAAVLQVYQLSVPTITIQMTQAKAQAIVLEPGLVLGLTCSTLWNRQGLRGVVDMDGIVLSVSRRLHAEAGTYDAVVALTGYSITANDGRWGPSGVVVNQVGTTIDLTMDNGEAVSNWFTTGDAVALTDPTGLVLDGTVTVVSSTVNSITVSGLGVAAAPGYLIELATWSVAQYPDTVYLGEGFDYV